MVSVKHIPLVHKLLLLDVMYFTGRQELFCFHFPDNNIITDFKDEDIVASIKALCD